ncbi:MAG TPA: TolC family protein, partial [Polyangiaceae bacterium]
MLGFTPAVSATQPLDTFLDAARAGGFDAREQAALVEQRSWEKEAALGRLLPAVSATGIYTRNQYESVIPAGPITPVELVITPQNQLDAVFRLDVPLVDLSGHQRYAQARHFARAAEAQRDLTANEIDQVVARSYYAFVGASALVDAAERSLRSSEQNLAYVLTRHAAGVATELDRERAKANVERSKQDRTQAELIRVTAARNLETLSGITPAPVTEYPNDDLRPEAPLNEWINHDTPADRLQQHLSRAAASGKKAAAYSLLPTLGASAEERISNSTGFSGRNSSYTLQAVLSWRGDYGTYAAAQAEASAADAQAVRSDRSRRNVEDEIFDAHERVRAGIQKSASARAEAEASLRAERLSFSRYQAGAITQLDVSQAQRDAFQAQAARIQADADLAYSRVVLRSVAGKPPRVPASTLPPIPATAILGEAPATVPPPAAPAPAPPPA